MKKVFSLISLMFVFIVSLFFVACGEKKQKDIDLNGDSIIEEWEKNFTGLKSSQTKVDADIEVASVEDFNNLSNKIIELQTREPQFATDENGETLYDEETNEPIYNESTLPIAKPVIKITKDIDFNGQEVLCQDLNGAILFGNNKVIKHFKLAVVEEQLFNHYNLCANAESITELNIFMGYQDLKLEQIGGDNYIDLALFRNCYNIENVTVKGMFNVNCEGNVDLNLSLLSYNSQYFDLTKINEEIVKEFENSENSELEKPVLLKEGLNVNNCKIIGRINYSDNNKENDSMKAVNISGLSVINLVDTISSTYDELLSISNNILNNTVDVRIDFNKEYISTKILLDEENYEDSDLLGFENTNISGILAIRRDNGYVTIDNCTSNMVLNIQKMYLLASVGGICGTNYHNSVIKNCKSTMSVLYGENNNLANGFTPTIMFGGIAGNSSGKILVCESNLTFEMTKYIATMNIGGIVGRMISNGEVSNCNVVTNIKAIGTIYSEVTEINGVINGGFIFAGGLAGYFENSLAYNNNVSGDIVAEGYIRTVLGGFISTSVDSTGIKNVCHTNVTNTNSLDAFVSAFLGIAYGGNYESCMCTGNVNANGQIDEKAEVITPETDPTLDESVTKLNISKYTNISIGLFFNYPFRNPERYTFSEFGNLENIENVNENDYQGNILKTYCGELENIEDGIKIDRFRQDESNLVIKNIYKDNPHILEDGSEGDTISYESLNNMTAVPSIKNCLILSKHNVQYTNSGAENGQLSNPRDVFKYISLNGLWASQNEGEYTYNTTIYLSNVQVFDLESTTSSAVALLKVNTFGDGTILNLIGTTQIKQMTNITKDNIWGCVRVYDKELILSGDDINSVVKNAKLVTGGAVSYYDKELSLSGAGADLFDLIIKSDQVDEVDDSYDDNDNGEEDKEDTNLYFKELKDELNTLVAYSINQMEKVNERVFTINFKFNCKGRDLDSWDSGTEINGVSEDTWSMLNQYEKLFIYLLDRNVTDIVFVDQEDLSDDSENCKYITIRYSSERNGVHYLDAYKIQRINIEDFKIFEESDGNSESYYSLKLTMYFSTSKVEG